MRTITAHTMVKNEARYVWFAVMSVIKYIDKIILWDTGSTDETLEIIKEIMKTPEAQGKVNFKQVAKVTPETFPAVRQEMLDCTKTDWLIMLDGDEIWWDDSIKKVVEAINRSGEKMETLVVPTINLVGDIYHYQDPSLGMYNLAGRKGHLALRGINMKIPGLHSYGEHGQWGWVDDENKMIQYRNQKKMLYIDTPYLHATNVPRAGNLGKEADVPKRTIKRKFELGLPFPPDYYYPEVFFRPRPEIVPSPWEKVDLGFKLRAIIETPLRKIKRRFIKKVGY